LVFLVAISLLIMSCAKRGEEHVSARSADLQFREKIVENTQEVGESCVVAGSRVRSSRTHVATVEDQSGKQIDASNLKVRSREMRFSRGRAVKPDTFEGIDEMPSPPPGVNSSQSPFPFMDEYLFLLAPVIPRSSTHAEIRPETQILAMSADSSGAEVRKALRDTINETPIGDNPLEYFTFAFVVNESVITKDLSDLAASEEDAKAVELADAQLDDLLVSADDIESGAPVKGIMIELDPPAEGLQTDSDKLMLWYRGKGTPSATGAELECKPG
jgi:hypothetical protein